MNDFEAIVVIVLVALVLKPILKGTSDGSENLTIAETGSQPAVSA
jgi:hypothetical protein